MIQYGEIKFPRKWFDEETLSEIIHSLAPWDPSKPEMFEQVYNCLL